MLADTHKHHSKKFPSHIDSESNEQWLKAFVIPDRWLYRQDVQVDTMIFRRTYKNKIQRLINHPKTGTMQEAQEEHEERRQIP